MGLGMHAMGVKLRQNLPQMMQAVAISAPGGPEVLQLVALPLPVPGPGQVLVRVGHAGVNRPDCLQRAGSYPPPPGASAICRGWKLRARLWRWAKGWRRTGWAAGSARWSMAAAMRNSASLLLIIACRCRAGSRWPKHAALPETLFTVWHNVFQRGFARDGEVLLVHGGTSGIGTMAIALGKLFGLTVIATCGNDEKCAAVRGLGADHAINYRTQDFVGRGARADRRQGRRCGAGYGRGQLYPAQSGLPGC